ncbi:MAG TPA: hypothetical protein VK037_04610 [Pseudogracilibacillus sp.]|nr:hypothetical protein [Pseudogracilibacillus sp.]
MKRQNRLSKISTILLLIAAGLFILSLFFPWWRMDFFAPQYPEGLDIIVYPDEVTGDIDIINNLNHYIGMKEFNTESFPELKFLKYIVYVFVVLTLIVAFTRNKLYLYILTALLAIGGAVGLIDMHFWLKEYGTNLDPNAAMYLDPFVPPIIGKNQIANFTTYSKFGLGGYILGVIFIIFVVCLWIERSKKNEAKKD